MKIKLLIGRSGIDFSHNMGDEIDVPADEAKRMIEAGQADPVRAVKAETTTRKARMERAVK